MQSHLDALSYFSSYQSYHELLRPHRPSIHPKFELGLSHMSMHHLEIGEENGGIPQCVLIAWRTVLGAVCAMVVRRASANAAILESDSRLASAARLAKASRFVSSAKFLVMKVPVLLHCDSCCAGKIGDASVLVNLSLPRATSSSKNRSKA